MTSIILRRTLSSSIIRVQHSPAIEIPAWFVVRSVRLEDTPLLKPACFPAGSIDAVDELVRRATDLSRRGRGMGVVAENGDILGYGQVTLWPRIAEISDLVVAESYRRQGIGTAIIHTLIDKVRAWHVSHVEIGAALSNTQAIRLYRRLGFRDQRIILLNLTGQPEPVMYLKMELKQKSL